MCSDRAATSMRLVRLKKTGISIELQMYTAVTYLIYMSQHNDIIHKKTSLDVNVFRYVVVLFFGGVI